jgi:membrane-bound metal-dependent hydrolase YbcI (DUF457 family)
LLIEHLLYATALAIIVGMIYERYTDVNPAWIIILVAFLPDSDYVVREGLELVFPAKRALIQHGDFHNIIMLLVFTVFIGYLISRIAHIKLDDSMICVFIGVLLHFLCDAFVYTISYPYFAPFSAISAEVGFFVAKENVRIGTFPIVSTNILASGLIVLAIAVIIRTRIQGYGWLIKPIPDGKQEKIIRILTNAGIFSKPSEENLQE